MNMLERRRMMMGKEDKYLTFTAAATDSSGNRQQRSADCGRLCTVGIP